MKISIGTFRIESFSILIESHHFKSKSDTSIRATDYRFIEFIVLYTILVAFNFSNKTFTSNEKLVTDFKKRTSFLAKHSLKTILHSNSTVPIINIQFYSAPIMFVFIYAASDLLFSNSTFVSISCSNTEFPFEIRRPTNFC